MGENLGQAKVKDILRKSGDTYMNGLHTDDANFNTSITYHDMEYAPTIVERGNGTYDPNNAYHIMNVDKSECVSLQDVVNSNLSILDEHPTIILNPGEQITTKYNWDLGFFELPTFDFLKDSYDIGSKNEFTVLVWSEEKGAYYVLDNDGAYYTAAHVGGKNDGRGYRYVYIDQLRDSTTAFSFIKK